MNYTVSIIMDTEVLPPVAKKQKQLSIAIFFGVADNAGLSRNGEMVQVDRKAPTLNSVGQDRLVPTDDQDIAVALSWRLAGTLSSERKLHCINSTLKASADYAFPFTETSKRRNYVNNSHKSGSHSCFYLSPSLNGLLCLSCVLFAPIKVGRGQSQPTGCLVTQALSNFSKLTGKDSYLTTHLQRDYHEDAVIQMVALKKSVATGTIAMQLDTQ